AEPLLEEPGEDQEALVVEGAANLSLAVHVDERAVANRNRGRDTGGAPELVIAQRDDRDPVHLPDPLARRRDDQRPLLDQLLHLLLDEIGAIDPLRDGPLDVLGTD